MQKKGFALIIFSIFLIGLIAAIGMAWTPPTAPPPQETVPAPLNTGSQPQTKQGPLTVKKLEVAPDSDEFFLINRSGATYPLSFKLGTDSAFVLRAVNLNILTVKEGKIGILADPPTATLDINGTIKIRGGNPGENKVLTSDANGLASWKSIETQFPDGTPNIRITTWLGKVGQQSSQYTRYGGSIAEGSPSTSGDYSYALDIKTHRYMTVLFEHRVVRGYRTCTYTLQKLTSSGWQDVVSTSWTGSSSDVKEETTRAEWDLNNIPNNTHLRIKISWTGAADEDDCMCSAMMAIHSNTPNTYFMPWNKFNLVNNVVPN